MAMPTQTDLITSSSVSYSMGYLGFLATSQSPIEVCKSETILVGSFDQLYT